MEQITDTAPVRTEQLLRLNYTQAMSVIVDMDHPYAAYMADNWRDTIRKLYEVYAGYRSRADDWRRRTYSQNPKMVRIYDPESGGYVRMRADEYNERRRNRIVAEQMRKAREVSGFAGNLLVRISTTQEARKLTHDFLVECRQAG